MNPFEQASDPERFPRPFDNFMRKWINEGYSDDEIIDRLAHIPMVNRSGGQLELAAERWFRLRLAAIRGSAPEPTVRRRPEPTVTPEQAAEAYARLHSQRLAAKELGISPTHLRRLAGLDD